jgi:hypothetical protein
VDLPAAAANPEGRRALLREQIQRAEPCGATGDGFLGESMENPGKIMGKFMGKHGKMGNHWENHWKNRDYMGV